MKFKFIFLLFNGIILFSFLFVFLMPLAVLGFDYTTKFWGQNWFLFLFFVAILGVLDGYFVRRWNFFRLLEAENWEGLSAHLEKEVFEKKKFSDQNVRFLFRAWLIQGKIKESKRLEALIREQKPQLLERHARMLGLNHLLENNPQDLVDFYGAFKDAKGVNGLWLRFGRTLGLAGLGDVAQARESLFELALQKKVRLLQLISLYMIAGSFAGQADSADEARDAQLEAARKDFIQAVGRKDLEKLRQTHQDDLELLVLGKVLDEAQTWVYAS